MPPIEDDELNGYAVLWPADGTSNEFGEPAVGDPVEIPVRWEFKREEVPGPGGAPIALDAVVVVNRRVPMDSRMARGTLAEWLGTGSDGDDGEVYSVASYSEVPDLKGREVRRVVGLTRYKDTPE